MTLNKQDTLKSLAKGNLLILIDELSPIYRDRDQTAREILEIFEDLKNHYQETPEDIDERMLRVKYPRNLLFKFLRHTNPQSPDSIRLGLVRMMRDLR